MKTLKEIVLEEILPRVRKPGQYAGSERNTIVKDHSGVDLKVALAFPDTYAVGMSHLGIKILYHILNTRKDIVAERVFAPWLDMEDELRKRGLPLYTLETFTPLHEFDVIGFSMQYELSFTNVLNMLEMGGVPVLSSARTGLDPVVIAGGSIALAMEPMAPFFDAILVGDAEETINTIMDAIINWKRSGLRRELYASLSKIPGVYVPSLYRIFYNEDGTVQRILNEDPAPPSVGKATYGDFENSPFPTKPVVPNVEVIHDRINIEIMRGCPNHCRFCQALQRYRPLKLRSPERILELCEETFRNTGYDEINLSSLSSADYPHLDKLLQKLAERFSPRMVNISLPSLRVGEELSDIAGLISSVRKAGLTFAPEVATDRLRRVIRKPVTNTELLRGCEAAYRAGYRLLKFYFMIGIPYETDEDLKAIVDLSHQASLLRKKLSRKPGAINVAVSSLIPKPHTPFQWEQMNSREELRAKQSLILSHKRSSSLHFKFHDPDESYIEAVFSRGDRRLAEALIKARERGIRMDAWSECFDIRAWEEVFRDVGLDADFYALRKRGVNEVLPWDMIKAHTPKSFLIKEENDMHDF